MSSDSQMDVAQGVWRVVCAAPAYCLERPKLGIVCVLAALMVAAGVARLYYYIWRWWNRKKVLIVGSPATGKTALFHRLRGRSFFWDAYTPTLSPMKQKWERERVSVQLVDLPGDPRLEDYVLNEFGKADIIIFMIDSTRFLEDIKDTAKKLWYVLGEPVVKKRRTVPILITLNKCEEGQKMFPDRFVKHRLETELENTRKKETLNLPAAPFKFTIAKTDVALASISVKNDHMTPVHGFLIKHLDDTPHIY